jgi:hypothetical protein
MQICSVPFTLTMNGMTLEGAHIISGGDALAPPLHASVLQGDALENLLSDTIPVSSNGTELQVY